MLAQYLSIHWGTLTSFSAAAFARFALPRLQDSRAHLVTDMPLTRRK